MAVVAVTEFRPSSGSAPYKQGQIISEKDSSSSLLLSQWVARGVARDTKPQGTPKSGRRLSPTVVHPLHVKRGTIPARLSTVGTFTAVPIPTANPAVTILVGKTAK